MQKRQIISLLFSTLTVIMLISGCGSSASSEPEVEVTGLGSEVEDFSSFYVKFHNDSLFQISRITWPLNGNYVQDSSGAAKDLKYIEADWTMHRLMLNNPDFVQQIEPLTEDLFIEEIKARAGKYKIERRFARLTGGWHLIHYQVSGI